MDYKKLVESASAFSDIEGIIKTILIKNAPSKSPSVESLLDMLEILKQDRASSVSASEWLNNIRDRIKKGTPNESGKIEVISPFSGYSDFLKDESFRVEQYVRFIENTARSSVAVYTNPKLLDYVIEIIRRTRIIVSIPQKAEPERHPMAEKWDADTKQLSAYFSDLTGSEKQIAWAKKLRADAVFYIVTSNAKYCVPDEYKKLLLSQSSSKFWIESRNEMEKLGYLNNSDEGRSFVETIIKKHSK